MNNVVNKAPTAASCNSSIKVYAGVTLLALSWLVPLAGVWVATLTLPVAVKSIAIGFLALGMPELLVVLAIAVMGTDGFDLILSKVKDFFVRRRPPTHALPVRVSISQSNYPST